MKTVLLTTATLPLYRYALAGLLINAVKHGSSVGHRPPLSYEDAEGYFNGLRHAIAKGERLLWIALYESEVVGTVQLELCQKSPFITNASL
ncbi:MULTISPECIES: hypothetical protein [Lonsdalea]|uniref:Uncharacterized protein n=2 Tax=Lonsdalea TaxID=1082702 RepID=A0ACD1J848_9GAMM|nr:MULTISPECIES: hypothetical protein [Lonsdalea]OSM93834.1 hypothetical protein AU508_15980 [Lonsdalea populi]OSM93946.1 hypothetical protein AU499_16600 [Lonsdalea populi]QPQ24057.1 hypothetical protein I6N93_16055 [Lonsdalea populi]RAT10023.1 hypothetical protein AU485_16985 [Lonsdalea quercina]RAT12161.1 hypothetical protein AU486_16370 [Lonsdalea quercina]